MIVDSHCHLDFPVLYDDLDSVYKRALNNKIKYLLTICTTLDSFEKIKKIINEYDNIYGTFGIHPHESNKHPNVDFEFIKNIKNNHEKIIGIGETGLDFYYKHSDKKTQILSFLEHIKAAKDLNIPLIVHSRNAEVETYDILKKEMSENLKIILHCFTGSFDFAKRLVDLNSYISISGIITFKKNDELEKVVSFIPLKNLLVETDSPYLSPVPNRGKSNEPSFIVHTIEKIALIKNTSKELIMLNTTSNFEKIFSLT